VEILLGLEAGGFGWYLGGDNGYRYFVLAGCQAARRGRNFGGGGGVCRAPCPTMPPFDFFFGGPTRLPLHTAQVKTALPPLSSLLLLIFLPRLAYQIHIQRSNCNVGSSSSIIQPHPTSGRQSSNSLSPALSPSASRLSITFQLHHQKPSKWGKSESIAVSSSAGSRGDSRVGSRSAYLSGAALLTGYTARRTSLISTSWSSATSTPASPLR
jgi:hypothetical protein